MLFIVGKLIVSNSIAVLFNNCHLYAADEGLHGRNVLQSLLTDTATQLLTINLPTTMH